MSATLSALRARSSSVVVEYAGFTINVSYNPARFTESLQAQIAAITETSDVHTLSKLVEEVVAPNGWDILGDDGTPVSTASEFTRDNIEAPLLNAVLKAVLGDLVPGEASAPNS